MSELVLFEILLVENGETEWWTSTIELENPDDWYKAAVRWLTNLNGTISAFPDKEFMGALHCRRADIAIYDAKADKFRISGYKYYGRIEESEWKIA